MNTHRIELEQFPTVVPRIDVASDGVNLELMGTNLEFGETRDVLEPGSDEMSIPLMDDPLIRPSTPDTDPAAEEIEALRAALEDQCTRLSDVVAGIEEDRDRIANATRSEAAGQIATVGGEIIGRIIDAGFHAEIAQAIAILAARQHSESFEVAIAPDDHDALAVLIAENHATGSIKIVSDPSFQSGQAVMRWPDGGAEFDAAELRECAAQLIEQRLADLTGQPLHHRG